MNASFLSNSSLSKCGTSFQHHKSPLKVSYPNGDSKWLTTTKENLILQHSLLDSKMQWADQKPGGHHKETAVSLLTGLCHWRWPHQVAIVRSRGSVRWTPCFTCGVSTAGGHGCLINWTWQRTILDTDGASPSSWEGKLTTGSFQEWKVSEKSWLCDSF